MARPKKNPDLKVVGGIGHNSGDLTEDQKIALHLNNHVPAYERALAAKKEADATFKNVCKSIKADGGSIDEVKLTIKLKTPEGEAALKAAIESQLRVARWNGLSVGTQGDLFGPDRRPIEERAAEDGKRAGLAGQDCKPPSGLSTEANGAWVSAWHEGQAVLAAGFGKKPDAEVLRPVSSDTEQGIDSFDAAANGDIEDYQPGDEVQVESDDDFEVPTFLRDAPAEEDA